MLLSALIDEINYALRGLDDTAPAESSDEANYWLSVVNQKKDDWATDSNENWSSLFAERTLATPVANGDNTYNLDADFIRPSDRITVNVGSSEYPYDITEPELRNTYKSRVYVSGKNPKVLNFNGNVTSDSVLDGGTITVPGYYLPDDLVAFSDIVPVDDPHWLAQASAAEIAFNDTSYEDKAPDILAKANELYLGMRAANKKSTSTVPLKIQTSVKKIGGPTC